VIEMRFLLVALLSHAVSNAATNASSQVALCKSQGAEIQAWWPKDRAGVDAKIPQDKIQRAFQIFDGTYHPSKDEIEGLRKSLGDDFAHGAVHWFGVAQGDCPHNRLYLAWALVNASNTQPKLKQKVSKSLKSALTATKYPTFLNAMIDVVIVEYGLKHGLWKSNKTLISQAAKLHADLKQEVAKWEKTYSTTYADNHILEGLKTVTQAEKIAVSKDFPKIKEGILKEIDTSGLYSQRLTKFLLGL
jgi:hypothetical protein